MKQLSNTPSRRYGIDADKELSYRRQAANFIQHLGQKLAVTQQCVNTAIVYTQRFYMFHPFKLFPRYSVAVAALFLAVKVEEQKKPMERILTVAHSLLHKSESPLNIQSELYFRAVEDLAIHENILLQTLGFDVIVEHPHAHILNCCDLIQADEKVASASYFAATNSLRLTTMCLEYRPTVVACFCIYLVCKWTNWEITESTDGKPWFWYTDMSVTTELLENLMVKFFDSIGNDLCTIKEKIIKISQREMAVVRYRRFSSSPFQTEPDQINSPALHGCFTPQTSCSFSQETPRSSHDSKLAATTRECYEESQRRQQHHFYHQRLNEEQAVTQHHTPSLRKALHMIYHQKEINLPLEGSDSTVQSKALFHPIKELASLERRSLHEVKQFCCSIAQIYAPQRLPANSSEHCEEDLKSPNSAKNHCIKLPKAAKRRRSDENPSSGPSVKKFLFSPGASRQGSTSSLKCLRQIDSLISQTVLSRPPEPIQVLSEKSNFFAHLRRSPQKNYKEKIQKIADTAEDNSIAIETTIPKDILCVSTENSEEQEAKTSKNKKLTVKILSEKIGSPQSTVKSTVTSDDSQKLLNIQMIISGHDLPFPALKMNEAGSECVINARKVSEE